MSRIYRAPFPTAGVSVSAVQDLWELTVAADIAVFLHEIHVTQRTTTTPENLAISWKYVPPTVTSGSGGGTITPVKNEEGDPASSVTVERNNTTRASTTGSIELKFQWDFNVIPGFHLVFTPETRPVLTPGEVYVVGLEIAPGTAMTMSGVVVFEEVG